MNNFKNKKLTNLEILNIYNYVNRSEDLNGEKTYPMLKLLNQFSTKVKWAFHVNLKKIEDVVTIYNNVVKDVQQEYSDDEHSIESTDTDNNKTKIRTIKEKYLKEYQEKIQELLLQENEISIKLISIDDLSDANLDFADLEILSFMINENE